MATASAVISTRGEEVRIRSTDTPENPRVRMDFGDIAVFFNPDAAHEIGAKLIAVAATISTAFRPELLLQADELQDRADAAYVSDRAEEINQGTAS